MGTFHFTAFNVVDRCQTIEDAHVDAVFGWLIPVGDFLLASKDLFAHS
jgi:hypothetical protein